MRRLSAIVLGLAALSFVVLSAAVVRPALDRQAAPNLPPPPAFSPAVADIAVRSVALFEAGEQEPVRIAAHPTTGHLFVLCGGGDVWLVDPGKGSRKQVLRGKDYIAEPPRQQVNIPLPIDRKWVNAPITLRATLCLGLCFDTKARLYLVANVQVPGKVLVNRVDLYRTPPVTGNGPGKPALWTRFQHAYGVGGFNHGACRIAQGPDGLIYLGSGSRTDHGEAGDEPGIGRRGEAPDPDVPGGPGFAGGDFTASILRFDPQKGQQVPEVFSRGNRNPFGFDWDDRGRLIDAEHGPMADHPEEINHIQRGRHYGFPYVFGDNEKPNYPDAPRPPQGLTFEPPIRNLGPGGLLGDHPMYSLAPHSAPGGLVFYTRGSLPKRYEKSFFLARFGNLVNYNRIGFDVLNVRLKEGKDGKLEAHTERFLDRLGRPLDVCVAGGKLYVVEYCRQSETLGPGSDGYTAPGRVLEVTGKR
jgi:glucose/arabinose dehydrogenase